MSFGFLPFAGSLAYMSWKTTRRLQCLVMEVSMPASKLTQVIRQSNQFTLGRYSSDSQTAVVALSL